MKPCLIPQVLLVAVLISGCASTSSTPVRKESAPTSAKPTSIKSLDALAAKGQHDALVVEAEQLLARETDPQLRAQLQLRRARALAASEHPRSAAIGFQNALDELPSETGELAAEILQAWGDADVGEERWREAL